MEADIQIICFILNPPRKKGMEGRLNCVRTLICNEKPSNYFYFTKNKKVIFFKISFIMRHMLTCVCLPLLCLVLVEVKRRHQILWTGVTEGCEPQCGFWEADLLFPLQEQQALLTAEPTL